MAQSALFVWEGTDKQGRKTKGEITSANPNIAKAELRKQGINATRVRKKDQMSGLASMGGGIKPADIALFTRQMATMMHAGVPLVQSFEIVADGVDKPKMRELILAVRTDVSGGNTFASAIRKHPLYFDDLFFSLVDAGEQSGALETMLDRIASYKEKTESLKAKVRKAMTYPIAVLVVAFIVSGILLIKVVPQFESVFAGFGAELPAFTQFVIGLSEVAQQYWLVVVAAIIAAVAGFIAARKRSKPMRDAIDRTLLKAPVVGNIIEKSAVARCTNGSAGTDRGASYRSARSHGSSGNGSPQTPCS